MPKVNLKLAPTPSFGGSETGSMRDAILGFAAGGRDFMNMAESFRKNRIADATNAALSQSAADGVFDKDDLANVQGNKDVNMADFLKTFNEGRTTQSTLDAQEITNRLTEAQAAKAEHEMSDDYLTQVANERKAKIDQLRAAIEASGSARDLNRFNLELAQNQKAGLEQFGGILKQAQAAAEEEVNATFRNSVTGLQTLAKHNNTTVDPAEIRSLAEIREKGLQDARNRSVLEATHSFVTNNPMIDISGTQAGQTYNAVRSEGADVRKAIQTLNIQEAQDTRDTFVNTASPTAMVKFGPGNEPTLLTTQRAINDNTIDYRKASQVEDFAKGMGLVPTQSATQVANWFSRPDSTDSTTNEDGIRDVLMKAGGSRDIAEKAISEQLAKDSEVFASFGDKEEKYVKDWTKAAERAEELRVLADGYVENKAKLKAPSPEASLEDVAAGIQARLRDAGL